jgi:hypothetical protein
MIPIAILMLVLVPAALQGASGPKFYPDDPILKEPKPRNTTLVKPRKTDALYDFIYNSFEPKPKSIVPAQNVNTLGEVPDSAWYTNRHYSRRMSLDELKRGPGDATPPKPPYSIVGAKLDGISPGFRMKDAKGTLYFIKPDPMSAPEIATAADAVGTRFFYALGYHTPKNYIVYIDKKDVKVSEEGTTDGANGKPRPMSIHDVEKVLELQGRPPHQHRAHGLILPGVWRLRRGRSRPGCCGRRGAANGKGLGGRSQGQ